MRQKGKHISSQTSFTLGQLPNHAHPSLYSKGLHTCVNMIPRQYGLTSLDDTAFCRVFDSEITLLGVTNEGTDDDILFVRMGGLFRYNHKLDKEEDKLTFHNVQSRIDDIELIREYVKIHYPEKISDIEKVIKNHESNLRIIEKFNFKQQQIVPFRHKGKLSHIAVSPSHPPIIIDNNNIHLECFVPIAMRENLHKYDAKISTIDPNEKNKISVTYFIVPIGTEKHRKHVAITYASSYLYNTIQFPHSTLGLGGYEIYKSIGSVSPFYIGFVPHGKEVGETLKFEDNEKTLYNEGKKQYKYTNPFMENKDGLYNYPFAVCVRNKKVYYSGSELHPSRIYVSEEDHPFSFNDETINQIDLKECSIVALFNFQDFVIAVTTDSLWIIHDDLKAYQVVKKSFYAPIAVFHKDDKIFISTSLGFYMVTLVKKYHSCYAYMTDLSYTLPWDYISNPIQKIEYINSILMTLCANGELWGASVFQNAENEPTTFGWFSINLQAEVKDICHVNEKYLPVLYVVVIRNSKYVLERMELPKRLFERFTSPLYVPEDARDGFVSDKYFEIEKEKQKKKLSPQDYSEWLRKKESEKQISVDTYQEEVKIDVEIPPDFVKLPKKINIDATIPLGIGDLAAGLAKQDKYKEILKGLEKIKQLIEEDYAKIRASIDLTGTDELNVFQCGNFTVSSKYYDPWIGSKYRENLQINFHPNEEFKKLLDETDKKTEEDRAASIFDIYKALIQNKVVEEIKKSDARKFMFVPNYFDFIEFPASSMDEIIDELRSNMLTSQQEKEIMDNIKKISDAREIVREYGDSKTVPQELSSRVLENELKQIEDKINEDLKTLKALRSVLDKNTLIEGVKAIINRYPALLNKIHAENIDELLPVIRSFLKRARGTKGDYFKDLMEAGYKLDSFHEYRSRAEFVETFKQKFKKVDKYFYKNPEEQEKLTKFMEKTAKTYAPEQIEKLTTTVKEMAKKATLVGRKEVIQSPLKDLKEALQVTFGELKNKRQEFLKPYIESEEARKLFNELQILFTNRPELDTRSELFIINGKLYFQGKETDKSINLEEDVSINGFVIGKRQDKWIIAKNNIEQKEGYGHVIEYLKLVEKERDKNIELNDIKEKINDKEKTNIEQKEELIEKSISLEQDIQDIKSKIEAKDRQSETIFEYKVWDNYLKSVEDYDKIYTKYKDYFKDKELIDNKVHRFFLKEVSERIFFIMSIFAQECKKIGIPSDIGLKARSYFENLKAETSKDLDALYAVLKPVEIQAIRKEIEGQIKIVQEDLLNCLHHLICMDITGFVYDMVKDTVEPTNEQIETAKQKRQELLQKEESLEKKETIDPKEQEIKELKELLEFYQELGDKEEYDKTLEEINKLEAYQKAFDELKRLDKVKKKKKERRTPVMGDKRDGDSFNFPMLLLSHIWTNKDKIELKHIPFGTEVYICNEKGEYSIAITDFFNSIENPYKGNRVKVGIPMRIYVFLSRISPILATKANVLNLFIRVSARVPYKDEGKNVALVTISQGNPRNELYVEEINGALMVTPDSNTEINEPLFGIHSTTYKLSITQIDRVYEQRSA